MFKHGMGILAGASTLALKAIATAAVAMGVEESSTDRKIKASETEERRQIREAREKRQARQQKEAELRTQALQDDAEGVSRQVRRAAQRKLDKASRKRSERHTGKR